MKLLTRKFFCRHPKTVAKDLLGKILVRKIGNKKFFYKIIETEAYADGDDDACHYVRYGPTKRTIRLCDTPGKSYVYSVHINMFCFNFVVHKEEHAGGVLIRGVEKLGENKNFKKNEFENKKILGPAKVCRELKIDKRYDGIDMIRNKEFFVIEGRMIDKKKILATKRINIDYAKKAKDWLWRFIVT
ncbi:MAG: DNA-3-methyladenine glycosylase [Endomicrobiia bacterium]